MKRLVDLMEHHKKLAETATVDGPYLRYMNAMTDLAKAMASAGLFTIRRGDKVYIRSNSGVTEYHAPDIDTMP